jgi:enoyl-CoA hydratase/carnithine racemase
MSATDFQLEERGEVRVVRLQSQDATNRLTRNFVLSLTDAIARLARDRRPIVLAGNEKFFCAGADLQEIFTLDASSAYEFSGIGQTLMNAVDQFPAPVYAAVEGYCMGGGLDLALACDHRVASPNAVFGHRGAALGLITGWGGTQRLPRLLGKGRALQMFVAAETIMAPQALDIGLVDTIAADPLAEAIRCLEQ